VWGAASWPGAVHIGLPKGDTTMVFRAGAIACMLAVITVPAIAQSSANYKTSDHVFNNGGGPSAFPPPSSVGFQISLHSIGDPFGTVSASSVGFQLQGSFVVTYRPPGEVMGLDFLDRITLAWLPEPSVGDYNVYRSEIPELVLGDTGLCLATQVTDRLIYDPFDPDPGHAWFYLVTASNRLDQEGTKGYRSNFSERPNPGPCP